MDSALAQTEAELVRVRALRDTLPSHTLARAALRDEVEKLKRRRRRQRRAAR